MIFSTMYGTQYGGINAFLRWLAGTAAFGWLVSLSNVELPINWLGRAMYIKPAIAILLVWKWFGWNTVLYLAGLQTIPEELYEAAAVDGASRRQMFWHVTLPLLRPITFFAVSLTIIGI